MSVDYHPLILERYIAIDHACGWPNLTLLPNGDIVALIWPDPCHGQWEGASECWGSTDGGHTWALRGVPVPHVPGTNRLNLSAGLAGDGALVSLVSGWENRTPRGIPGAHSATDPMLPPVPARSLDGGYTWENHPAPLSSAADTGPHYGDGIRMTTATGAANLTPFGDIWPLADGALGTLFYTSRVHFYTSSNEGRTWTHRATFGQEDQLSETTWLPLPDGRLLAAARTEMDQRLDLFTSDDQGCTWVYDQPLTGNNEHPAALTLLHDGAVLLTYGIRTDALYGIGVRLSRDGGRSWSEPQVLVDLEGSTNPHSHSHTVRDGGYPATVQLGDGTLVTAFYCKGVSAHLRYHVGVVRWRLG